MPINLIRTTDTCTLVHTDDPEVTAPEGADGWIPVDTCEASLTATRLTVRPLNGWEMLQARAEMVNDSQAPMVRRVLTLGLLEIDGSAEKAAQFVDSPEADHLFGVFLAITELGERPLPVGLD